MSELDVRQHLVQALEADLVGPFVPDDHPQGSQEVLPIAPSRWYLTGFLAPHGGRAPDVDDKDSEEGGLELGDDKQAEDSGSDEPEAKRQVRFPASMGLSVFLPPGSGDSLEVNVWYADYDKIEVAREHSERKVIGWKRVLRIVLDSARAGPGSARLGRRQRPAPRGSPVASKTTPSTTRSAGCQHHRPVVGD